MTFEFSLVHKVATLDLYNQFEIGVNEIKESFVHSIYWLFQKSKYKKNLYLRNDCRSFFPVEAGLKLEKVFVFLFCDELDGQDTKDPPTSPPLGTRVLRLADLVRES